MNSADKFKSFREEQIDDICECDDLYEDLEITEAEYEGKKVKLGFVQKLPLIILLK